MKKKRQMLGRQTKLREVTVEYRPGSVVVESLDEALETLEEMEAAMEAVKPVYDFIEQSRKAVTMWVEASKTPTLQMDDHYWRRIQRTNKLLVATDDDMPAGAPKNAKSLKTILSGRKNNKGVPYWNMVTRRVIDPGKLDAAVKKGLLTDKEIAPAYLETPGNVFIQRFDGIPPEEREDDA